MEFWAHVAHRQRPDDPLCSAALAEDRSRSLATVPDLHTGFTDQSQIITLNLSPRRTIFVESLTDVHTHRGRHSGSETTWFRKGEFAWTPNWQILHLLG